MRRLLVLFAVLAIVLVSCDSDERSPLNSGSAGKGTLSIVIADTDDTSDDGTGALSKLAATEQIDQLEIRILASNNSVVLTRTLAPEGGVFSTTIEIEPQNDLKVLCIGMSDGVVEKFGIDEDVDVAPGVTTTAYISGWNQSYTPAMSAITPSPSEDGNYTVVWTSVHTAVQYDLQVADNAGFADATLAYSGENVIVNVTGKSPGTYYYRARASNSYNITSDWSEATSVVVNESGVVVEVPVLNDPGQSVDTGTEYTVSWSDVAGSESYTIEEATSVTFAGASQQEVTGTSVSFTHEVDDYTTYYYRVRTNTGAGSSGWSDAVDMVVLPETIIEPGELAIPIVTDPGSSVSTGTEYTVSWTAVEGATSYTLEEDVTPSFDNAATQEIDGTSSNMVHTVDEETIYYYRVRANDADSSSGWSNISDIIIKPEIVVVLSAPVLVDPGASVLSGVEYTISWAEVAGAASYLLDEATTVDFEDAVTSEVIGDSEVFTKEVTENTVYFYRIRAKNGEEISDFSNAVDITVFYEETVQGVPVLSDPGASVLTDEEYTLTWTAVESGISYTVEEATSMAFDDAVSQDVTETSVTFSHSVTSSTAYYYRVRANFTDGSGDWSNAADMLVIAPDAQLEIPGVSVSSDTVLSGDEYTVFWNTIPDATMYIIMETESDAQDSPVQLITTDASYIFMHDVEMLTEYGYHVRAVSDNSISTWSEGITVTVTIAPPAVPALVDPGESIESDVEYTLMWDPIEEADSYVVEESTTADFSADVVSQNADAPGVVFMHTVEEEVTYYYRALARNAGGDSDWSSVVDMLVTPAELAPMAPTDLTITDVTASSVALSWTDNSDDEDGFSIEIMTFDSDWSEAATVEADETSYRVLRLGSNTEYSFRIRAYREDNYSDYSNEVTDTTPGLVLEGRIVYTSFRDNDYEIYVVNVDGTGEVRLTDAIGSDTNPSWSNDGSTIAFQTERNGSEEIYLVGDDGSNLRKVADGAYPSFSPDGSQIVYEYNEDIWVINVDGTNPVQLTTNGGFDGEPSFSPDGTQILYVSDRDDGDWEIYVMDIDGTNQQRLTFHEGYDQEPEFSPDGYEITFSRVVDGIDVDVYVMEPDGSNIRQLTEDADSYSSSWSPNGAGVVYTSSTNGKDEIFIMDSYGGNVIQVTNGGYNSRPEWSPF